MRNWIEREEEQLAEQFENGELTSKEYQEAIRDLQREARACAELEAGQARDDYYYR